MSYKCPSCSADVPGVVPQSTLTERLASKDGQLQAIRAELAEATTRAATLAAEVEPLKAAHAELAALKGRAEEDAAFAAAGLSPQQQRHRDYARSLYQDAIADLPEDKRPALADWLTEQVKAESPDPLLASMRASPGTPAAPVAPSPVRPPVRTPPPAVGGGNAPPPPSAAPAPAAFAAALQSFIASPAFDRSKPVHEQLPPELRPAST